MNAKTIDEQGAIDLIAAVVKQTKRDFMITTPDSYNRKAIEREIMSEHFEILTGLNGSKFVEQLREEYDKKHRKARKGK